jgi:hypothetical protein
MSIYNYHEVNSEERWDRVRSQKALNLHKYAESGYKPWKMPTYQLLLLDDSKNMVEEAVDNLDYQRHGYFLRTCPEHARHGVLESVRCKYATDVVTQFKRLRDIMREDDPNGCLLLMPFVQAESSGVLYLTTRDGSIGGRYPPHHGTRVMFNEDGEPIEVPHRDFQGYISIGPDHDGITAGRGLNIGIPLKYNGVVNRRIAKDHNACPSNFQLEFVFSGNKAKFTQYRKGPQATPVTPPPCSWAEAGIITDGEVIVNEVWRATGLEEVAWLEQNIIKSKVPEGFVVIEPEGSRQSHIYAHCNFNDIPYIVTDNVNIGDRYVGIDSWTVLDNEKNFEPQPYDASDYIESFKRGVDFSNEHWDTQQGWLSTFFHQFAGGEMFSTSIENNAYLAGVFAGYLPKAMLAVGMGEMRHGFNKHKQASPLTARVMGVAFDSLWRNIGPGMHDRKDYYYAMEKTLLNYKHAEQMAMYLRKEYNRPGWSSGYGGKSWGESMSICAKLFKALSTFMDNPTKITFKALGSAVNAGENAEHNNGALLNKFLNMEAFDIGTNGIDLTQHMPRCAEIFKQASIALNGTIKPSAEPPIHSWSYVRMARTKYHIKWLIKNGWENVNPILRDYKFRRHDNHDISNEYYEMLLHPSASIHSDSYNVDDYIKCPDGCSKCDYFEQMKVSKQFYSGLIKPLWFAIKPAITEQTSPIKTTYCVSITGPAEVEEETEGEKSLTPRELLVLEFKRLVNNPTSTTKDFLTLVWDFMAIDITTGAGKLQETLQTQSMLFHYIYPDEMQEIFRDLFLEYHIEIRKIMEA